jgi:hypothetical protein
MSGALAYEAYVWQRACDASGCHLCEIHATCQHPPSHPLNSESLTPPSEFAVAQDKFSRKLLAAFYWLHFLRLLPDANLA